MANPIVRAATDADIKGLRAVADHFDLLEMWPNRPDFLDAEREFGDVLVGEVDGRIVGFGGTLRRGTVTHLGDLFVHPDHQSSGVGRMILDRLLPRDTPKVTFASDDERALGLYVRNGMRPRCPLLYLERRPPGERAGQSKRGTQSVQAGGDVGEAAALDARVSGGERTSTLAWYARLPGVTAWASGSGYAFTRVVGDEVVIGPAGGETPQDCVDAVLEAATGYPGAKLIEAAVPGDHPLLPLLLHEGWHIDDMDNLMTSDDIMQLDRYVPHPDLG